jgi:hypothetical protein
MSLMFAQMFPGMDWISLMLLCLVVGLCVGVLGILVGLAVSNSRFAYRAGIFACVIGVGSPVFFLLVAGRHLMPQAYPCLAIPLFVGLVAVGLSFRCPVRWLGEVESRTTEAPEMAPAQRSSVANRTVRVTVVLTGVAVALVACCAGKLRTQRAFDRLLAGDRQVAVSSVLITGQGKRVLLDDVESARYLTDSFRSVQRDPPHLGITYTAEVRLSSGGSVKVGLYIPEDGDGVAMSWPLDSLTQDPTYYWLPLPEPVPPTIAAALRVLR